MFIEMIAHTNFKKPQLVLGSLELHVGHVPQTKIMLFSTRMHTDYASNVTYKSTRDFKNSSKKSLPGYKYKNKG